MIASQSSKENLILKVLVGSQAHGLANKDSDYDYRGVYVLPTKDILSLGFNYKGSHWLEGEKEDQTAWEIGHFLHLATKCNPTILEAFKAPLIARNDPSYVSYFDYWGSQVFDLFPYVWNPKDAYNAFVGYSGNQEKKMRTNHLNRWNKYAVAYLRTLWNLCDLLETGDFSLEIKSMEFKEYLLKIRNTPEKITQGEIMNMADQLKSKATILLKHCNHEPDLDRVNEFLLKIRKEFWE